jgi:hypothetical protein
LLVEPIRAIADSAATAVSTDSGITIAGPPSSPQQRRTRASWGYLDYTPESA